MNIEYTRLFADSLGESHFEEISAPLASVDFAPGAPPLNLSALMSASHAAFFGAGAGWRSDWHPSSARNLFVVLTGIWEVEASDGTVRQFGPHSVLLVEDTTGKGHRSRVVGSADSLSVVTQLES